MESKGDEASHLHAKQGKYGQFPTQDSSFRIPILPAELITEILLKLPVKFLVQFRCVSKSWLALISSPEFVNSHLSISANNKSYTHHRLMLRMTEPEYNLMDSSLSSLLYDSVAARAVDLDYPIIDPHKNIWIIGSVNGLICLCMEGIDYIFWNPSIRKFKKISNSIHRCHLMYGFGYDELHDDYKIVVGVLCNSVPYEVNIYSLNSSSWTRIYNVVRSDELIHRPEGVFMNDKFHWSYTTKTNFDVYNGWAIISMDLANGKWEKFEMPCYGEGDFDSMTCMAVLRSHLSVFFNDQSSHTDVWILNEYEIKESWTKIFTINHPLHDPTGNPFSPLFCMPNEGEILFQSGSSFMIYNPKDDSIKHQVVTSCDGVWKAYIYIESLVWCF